MAASLAGGATPDVLRAVTGVSEDPHIVASTVPLVTIDADDTLVPHALWSEALRAQMGAKARQHMLSRLVAVRSSRGEHGEALQIALKLSDPDAIAAVVR